MKVLRQVGVILLLLVSFVAPAMACMTPDGQMTAEERACCRMMKSQCGQMEMPGSQNCCKKAPKTLDDTALKVETVSFHPSIFVAVWASHFELLAPHDAANEWVQRPQHSPPKPPPSAITVLRI